MKLLNIILLLTIMGLSLFLFPGLVSASTLYLSPEKGRIQQGKIIKADVKLKIGGDAVNAVSAFLSYPPDKLEVAWINYDNSAFSIEAESTSDNGLIKISRGSFSPRTGNVSIATIGFRGKSEGKALVSFADGSAAPRASDSSDSLDLRNSKGGTYNITRDPKSGRPATLGEKVSWVGLRLNSIRNTILLIIGTAVLILLILRKKRH